MGHGAKETMMLRASAWLGKVVAFFGGKPAKTLGNSDPIGKPSDAARLEAKRNPGGWVYQIDGNYSENDSVPNWAVAGAWKVDAEGCIEDPFIPNPQYDRVACRKRDLG